MPKRLDSDETYVINLCDEILNIKGIRQHRFDFLRGDIGKNGKSRRLPVDVYYLELNLVVEYREKQHEEPTSFFDKPDKMTISGVSRGEQRKVYDQRRRDVLPKHGITLLEISYKDFQFDSRKRIVRNNVKDIAVLRNKLKKWI